MSFNREQIIKGLEMFIDDMPVELHLGLSRTVRFRLLLQDTLLLIKELTEENERLTTNLVEQSAENVMLCGEVKQVRLDTVRKMQERLTTFFENDDYIKCVEVDAEYINEQINNIAKEMEEKL